MWAALVLGAIVVLAGLTPGQVGSAVELRDAEIVAAGSATLQNGSGSVRLEGARLGRLGPAVSVPEASVHWLLGAGAGLIGVLARRRRGTHRTRTRGHGSTMRSFCLRSACLGILILVGSPALAQVPEDTTFTGRLVDALGDPLGGPVDLELRVFDAETGPAQLYSEEHIGVTLDATGGFSVQLGLGTSASGTYDANLFSGVDRWLEVVVNGDELTPRQVIGSVPWALIAQQANEIVPDPNAPRFEDCGDGTVADRQTGLRWEKKNGIRGSSVDCSTTACPDPHDVNNLYRWSVSGTEPDGDAFTDFLNKLNDQAFGTAANPFEETGCFAGHCDWRLPSSPEQESIVDCTFSVGANEPCIDPIFGPTESTFYGTGSSFSLNPSFIWGTSFDLFPSDLVIKASSAGGIVRFRAVRVGSCR